MPSLDVTLLSLGIETPGGDVECQISTIPTRKSERLSRRLPTTSSVEINVCVAQGPRQQVDRAVSPRRSILKRTARGVP